MLTHLLSFNTSKVYSLSFNSYFSDESAIILTVLPLYVTCLFPLAVFNTFFFIFDILF